MEERKYFVLCESNCKFESMTKEQIIAAIAEATGTTVMNVDAAFITKLKEQNRGDNIKFWVGTQAEYNAIVASGNIDSETFYCTSDGGTIQELCQVTDEVLENLAATNERVNVNAEDISKLEQRVEDVEKIAGGVTGVLPIAKGGTGASSVAAARKNLGLGNTSGALPIANGGTGATEMSSALGKLGLYSRRTTITLSDINGNGSYFGTTEVKLSRLIPNSNYTCRAFASVVDSPYSGVTLMAHNGDYVGDLVVSAHQQMPSSTGKTYDITVDVLMMVVLDV